MPSKTKLQHVANFKEIHTSCIVGFHEIGVYLNISPQAVMNWANRFLDFPQPVLILKAGRFYDCVDIAEWANEHGKI